MTRARPWAVQPDEILSWACGVFLLLIFSQAWIFPIFGEKLSPSAGSLIRLVYFPAYAAGLYLLFSGGLRSLEALFRAPVLLALLMTAGLSYFWSFDPSGTMKRVIALGLTMACAYGLAARFSWNTLAEIVGGAFLVLIVFSLLLGLLLPDIGKMNAIFPGAWRGAWPEKNNLGGNMTIGCMVLVAAAILNPARRWLWAGGAVFALLLILLSTSKTSLVALILGFGCLVFIGLVRRGPVLSILTVWLAVAGLVLVGGILAFAAEEILGLLGKDATLTGRTEIWDGIARVVADRPLTGYGYGVVWEDESPYAPLAKITKVAGFRAYHAHSGWYEVWLELGIIGLIVWGLTYGEAVLRALLSAFRNPGAYLALPVFIVYGLMTLTESVTLVWNDIRWVLFCALLIRLSLPEPRPDPYERPDPEPPLRRGFQPDVWPPRPQ